MPRKLKNSKKYIVVACEGESEEAYARFLKTEFHDVAVFKIFTHTAFFEEANRKLSKEPVFRDNAEETDEIWFFFDVELKDRDKWESRQKIINKLRKMRKNPGIRVRLLMTSGCIEYWLMLHFKRFAPPIQTDAEKASIIRELAKKEPSYQKGDGKSTGRIAIHYPVAVENGRWTMENLVERGLPTIIETDERNSWLCTNCLTFSSVFEAIEYLQQL